MKTLSLGFLIASISFAQVSPGGVDGPVLGLVFDAGAGGIRPLLGVPGSAVLGQSLDATAGLRDAAVSAAGGYAIGVDAQGAATLISTAGRAALPGAGPGATRLTVSPRGSAAGLYFAASGSVQVFTGLPGAPSAARTVTLDLPPSALALSDDGATLLAVSHDGRNGDAVYSYQAGQASLLLYRARRIAALAFVPGGSNAVVAEPNAVKLVSPAFGIQTVADQGIEDVSAVAASGDGTRIVIATRSGRVVVHDLRSSTETAASCACAPGALIPLRGNAVFRLNEPGDGPLWLLDADSPSPRILFVAAQAGGSR